MSNTINNLEETLENDGLSLLKVFGKKGGERPLSIRYRTKIYVSPLYRNTFLEKETRTH